LCEAPFGPFRQNIPGSFFVPRLLGHGALRWVGALHAAEARRAYPPELDRVLADVAKRRWISCDSQHGRPSIPRRRWVRVTNPHLNDFLLAPLVKRAGGTERCGRAVFANTEDPDYQAILEKFEAAKELLSDPPRADLQQPRG